MKKTFRILMVVAFAVAITTSCNSIQGQVAEPGGATIYNSMQVFVPKSQMVMNKLNSSTVYSDAGRMANTAAAVGITNTQGDGKTDYVRIGQPQLDILVSADVSGNDGIVDVAADPLTGGVIGFPMEYNSFIAIANHSVQPRVVTRNGIEGYIALLSYNNFYVAYAGESTPGILQQNGKKYSVSIEIVY